MGSDRGIRKQLDHHSRLGTSSRRAVELAVYAAVAEPKPEEFRSLILRQLVKGLGLFKVVFGRCAKERPSFTIKDCSSAYKNLTTREALLRGQDVTQACPYSENNSDTDTFSPQNIDYTSFEITVPVVFTTAHRRRCLDVPVYRRLFTSRCRSSTVNDVFDTQTI